MNSTNKKMAAVSQVIVLFAGLLAPCAQAQIETKVGVESTVGGSAGMSTKNPLSETPVMNQVGANTLSGLTQLSSKVPATAPDVKLAADLPVTLLVPKSQLPDTKLHAASTQDKKESSPKTSVVKSLLTHAPQAQEASNQKDAGAASAGSEKNFIQAANLGQTVETSVSDFGAAYMDASRSGLIPNFHEAKTGTDGVSPVAPQSFEAYNTPGVDIRLMPVVKFLKSEIESDPAKFERLGHLLWALQDFLKNGGALVYGVPLNGKQELTAAALPDLNSVIIHFRYQNINVRLQAALLALSLQQLYDYKNGRSWTTREANMRWQLALDAFLDRPADPDDMLKLSGELNVNDALETGLFMEFMNNRINAGYGTDHLEGTLRAATGVDDYQADAAYQIEQSRRDVSDTESALQAVKDVMARKSLPPALTLADLQSRKRILEARLQNLYGNLKLHELEAAQFAQDAQPNRTGTGPDLRLAVDKQHRSRLDLAALRVVPVQSQPQIAPQMEKVIDLVRGTINNPKTPATRDLSYLLTALDELLARGGRVFFDFPQAGNHAYFTYDLLQVVLGWPLMRVPLKLAADILVHELTHLADFLGIARPGESETGPRPMTRETEYAAFTNQAIFAQNFTAEEIVAEIEANPGKFSIADARQIFQLVFHAVKTYVEGQTSLEAMISDSYRQLFGTHMQGLQTAKAIEEDLKKRLGPERANYEFDRQSVEISQMKSGPDSPTVRSRQKIMVLRLARIQLLERQAQQLQRAQNQPSA